VSINRVKIFFHRLLNDKYMSNSLTYMVKDYSDKEINNILTLYSILCTGNKNSSIQYLDGVSDVCKTEDPSQRTTLFRERMRKLLSAT